MLMERILSWGMMISIVCFAGLIVYAFFESEMRINREKSINFEEIGLNIDNNEKECFQFCNGGDYYYRPSTNGGFFSSGKQVVCLCSDNKN